MYDFHLRPQSRVPARARLPRDERGGAVPPPRRRQQRHRRGKGVRRTGQETSTLGEMLPNYVLFGNSISTFWFENPILVSQSIGGTGPLRAGAELLRRRLGFTRAVYSDPTWINHRDIFEMAGFDRVEPYTYYDRQKQGIIQNICRAPRLSEQCDQSYSRSKLDNF